ncbi:MAG: glycosyltransferase family 4 protein [Acetobacteraceae bacterium]|nr:glycosyltransferase family 4 protein [Acetobacteraceae bacterium]
MTELSDDTRATTIELEAPEPATPEDSVGNGGTERLGVWPHQADQERQPATRPLILFDISDLVYYLGHHPNLSGIQRVQASVLLGLMEAALYPPDQFALISYDTLNKQWIVLRSEYMGALLRGMFLPADQRRHTFDIMAARHGILPSATSLEDAGLLHAGCPSVLCLLGAAWVRTDYFREVLQLKRVYGMRFVMCLHDLIPIYAPETCDQGTVKVFEEFMRRALRHTDCFLAVSTNTATDLARYTTTLRLRRQNVVVTGNGSSFQEFMGPSAVSRSFINELPRRFVLFVSTIEGRKNHQFIFDLWRDLIAEGVEVPHLVCVGRLGWKSEAFLGNLVETGYLRGKLMMMHDVSDAELHALYARCLFTVFPSLYEGWGLPVSESLAAGKICVLSDRASLPEVAGDLGVYVDLDDKASAKEVLRRVILDADFRAALEQRIRAEYRLISWSDVAGRVIEACQRTQAREWEGAYPYPLIEYGTEISFAQLQRDANGAFGDQLLSHVTSARNGVLLPQSLKETSFLLGEEGRFGPGWAQPEDWGCWMQYPAGELAFYLPPIDDDVCFLFVRLRTTGSVERQRMEIMANGEVVWAGVIGRPQTVCGTVRTKQATAGPWKLSVRFQVPFDAEIREELFRMDERCPAIGLDRIVVVNRSDVLTRVELLQRLILTG